MATLLFGKAIPDLWSIVREVKGQKDKARTNLAARIARESARALAEHHLFAARWAEQLHPQAAAPAVTSDGATVELVMRNYARRLGTTAMGSRTELELLLDDTNYVILGDPGAGKTTTMRRLVQQVTTAPPANPTDPWDFAIVIVGRETDWQRHHDLYDCLAEVLGIGEALQRELEDPKAAIREVAGTAAVLFVDGLDEIPPERRGSVERDLINLGRTFPTSKIIASCRSGDYDRYLDGFETAEIEPLDASQISSLVTGWLGERESQRFMEAALKPDHPAHELANRPLFLTQMVALYVRRNRIPERPADLCRSIVRLVIEDWDDQRGVKRTSRYSNFGREEKFSFLADLAYELMAEGLYRFETSDLEQAYRALAPRYELPNNQAPRVAREIESHTGLVVESGGSYEFSHLSLQEFLTADSMIRRSTVDERLTWVRLPALTAICIALAPDGNDAIRDFAEGLPPNIDDISPLRSFLQRLGHERPRFQADFVLAEDLLWLTFKAQVAGADDVDALFKLRPVRQSIEMFRHDGRYQFRASGSGTNLIPSPEYGAGRTFSVPAGLLT